MYQLLFAHNEQIYPPCRYLELFEHGIYYDSMCLGIFLLKSVSAVTFLEFDEADSK